MGICGGTIRARPAMRLNRPRGLHTFIIFSLSGPYSLEALSDSMIAGHITGRNNQGGKKLRRTSEPLGGL